MMKQITTILIALLFGINGVYSQALDGEWNVTGETPKGQSYEGSIKMTFIGKAMYKLNWDVLYKGEDEIKTFPGTAFYDKENRKLTAAYGVETERYGLFSYDLNEEGGLFGTGLWTSHKGKGAELIGGELGKDVIEGRYEVVGRRPQGDVTKQISETYKGILEIKKNGKRYHLTWTLGDNTPYNGFGYVSGDKLVGVWGIGEDYGLETYTLDETRLLGTAKWTSPFYDFKPGMETISKK
ncbi:MAG: hypothetical protein JXR03_06995 [Cyclobacteriaceae bacterium]